MIEVKQLTKDYAGVPAVKGAGFKLPNGKVYGLFGGAGAGKTTLLNLMTGVLSPTEGVVRINGFDVWESPLRAKKCFGYLPEVPPLYKGMTVNEYLTFVAGAKGLTRDEGIRQIRDVLEQLQLVSDKDRAIRGMSADFRRRLGLAQALLGNPEILFLDDPTEGLEPQNVFCVRNLIRSLAGSHTVILGTANFAEVSEVCDRVLVLSDGEIAADLPIEEVRARTGYRNSRLFLTVRAEEETVIRVLSSIPGIEICRPEPAVAAGASSFSLALLPDADVRDELFAAFAEQNCRILSLDWECPAPDELLPALTRTDDGDGTEAEN